MGMTAWVGMTMGGYDCMGGYGPWVGMTAWVGMTMGGYDCMGGYDHGWA